MEKPLKIFDTGKDIKELRKGAGKATAALATKTPVGFLRCVLGNDELNFTDL
jgi:hypothetical protein